MRRQQLEDVLIYGNGEISSAYCLENLKTVISRMIADRGSGVSVKIAELNEDFTDFFMKLKKKTNSLVLYAYFYCFFNCVFML